MTAFQTQLGREIFHQQSSLTMATLVLTVFNALAGGFTNLHNFSLDGTNGADPWSSVLLCGQALYGTTAGGGVNAYGTVFRLNADGSNFTNLHNFGINDGNSPQAGLVLSGNTLYGTTYWGVSGNFGSLFAVNTDGTGFTNLHRFPTTSIAPSGAYTNVDGAGPFAKLVLSGDSLYGTTATGGSGASGTIFKVNTNGTGFTVLHTFGFVYFNNFTGTYTNSDGGGTSAGMVLSAIPCTGQRPQEALGEVGRYSRSKPMARVSLTCFISQHGDSMVLLRTLKEIGQETWCCLATHCTGRLLGEAIGEAGRCS